MPPGPCGAPRPSLVIAASTPLPTSHRPAISRPARCQPIDGEQSTAAYVELAQHQNGGIPARTCHRTGERTSWAKDHIAISGIYAIGETKACSLLGAVGSKFWPSEWGYPEIGVYFADCPSAGHDMLCLDYRECGPTGEPRVVHVDQECDYRVTFVERNFESFVRGLVRQEDFTLDD